MTAPPLIDIHNATIWRGKTCVFRNLSLQIQQDERVAILGPNGSGKTTLLMTINRELYPTVTADSHVRILGQDTWNVWQLRQQIGLVSNDLHLRYTPTTTAIEVVVSGFHSSIGVHGVLAHRVTREQIDAAQQTLGSLGIGTLRDTALQHMSSGQQRRCLLARSLVHRPTTLILDEPTAGLDFAASFDYLRRLQDLSANGHNIVIVTHHLNEIPPQVDRVILLQNGSVVADDNKAAVLTERRLSDVYQTSIRVQEANGYYLAYPA